MEVPEDITENLVKLALKCDKGENANLLSFDVQPLDNVGDHFLSVISSIKVMYDKGGSEHQESYVSKTNTRTLQKFSDIFDDIMIREIDVLSKVIEGMNKQLEKLQLPRHKIPRIYASSSDKGKEVLIMQNLRAEGFTMFNLREGLDMNHSRLVLKELGRLHASSYLYEEGYSPITTPLYFKLPKYESYHGFLAIMEGAFMEHLQNFMNFLKKYESKHEKLLKWLEKNEQSLKNCYLEIYIPSKTFINVWAHGDFKINNMMFKYNEDKIPVDVRFVDFQFFRKASPGFDLNSLFYSGLNADFRLKEMDNMLVIYYDSFNQVLQKAGKTPLFSYQKLVEEVKDSRIYGMLPSLIVLPSIILQDNISSKINSINNPIPDTIEQLIKMHSVPVEAFEKGGSLTDRLISAFEDVINNQ